MTDLVTCEDKAREIIEALGLTTENSVEIRVRNKGRIERQRYYHFFALGFGEEKTEAFDKIVKELTFEQCINIWRTNTSTNDGVLFDLEVNHENPEDAATSMANLALYDRIAQILLPTTPPEKEFFKQHVG